MEENTEEKNIAEEKKEKLYYSINEVAQLFNVNASLLRFWEKEFTVIKPRKNAKTSADRATSMRNEKGS